MKSEPIIAATLDAIAKAQCDYDKWSGGDWLGSAAEYMATVTIAKALTRLDEVPYVTMEGNVRSAVKEAAGAVRARGRRRIRPQGRCDIVLWEYDIPRVLLEVKTRVSGYSKVERDIKRLRTALHSAPDILWCMVAYYVSFEPGRHKPAEDRVTQRVDRVYERAVDVANRDGSYRVSRHPSRVNTGAGGAWTAEVLKIDRSR